MVEQTVHEIAGEDSNLIHAHNTGGQINNVMTGF